VPKSLIEMMGVVLVAAMLAGCAAPASLPRAATAQGAPKLPRDIVRTDGHGAVFVSSAGAATCNRASPQELRAALAATNLVRAEAGLSPLRPNTQVQHAAEMHACDMARRGLMTHAGTASTGPSARVKGLGYRPSVTAENIAAGAVKAFDLNGTLSSWAGSPGHRANILNRRVKDFGIGSALSPDGRVIYWAAVYARPR